MKITESLKRLAPYILSIILFIVISFAYFNPVLDGKKLPQMDNTHARGMAKELVDFEKNNPGEYSGWTNSMFSGMPAYQIKGPRTFNIHYYIYRLVSLNLPYTTVAILFIYMLGFYILLITLKVDKWVSFIGALAFGFSTFNIIYILAGHITKTYAIGFMAPVIAGVILTFRKKYIAGGILTTIALGMEIAVNHVQITYYLAIAIAIYALVEFIYSAKQKDFKPFFMSSVVLILAAVLAVGPNITNLLTTWEYGEESIRGKNELTEKKIDNESGLDKEYAFAWSYGKTETFSLLIPNAVGGGSGQIGNVEGALDDVDRQFKQVIAGWQQYWGAQSFTVGPVYFGAIVCFLFILGLFYVRGRIKWWIFAGTVLSVLLSWGSNFSWFNDLFFEYFPLYNKFRTPMTTLMIAQVLVPFLAVLALWEIIKDPAIIRQNKRGFFIALAITGGLSLLFGLLPSLFTDFINASDKRILDYYEAQVGAQTINALVDNLAKARATIVRQDAFRSFAFIALAAVALWLFYKKTIKRNHVIIALGILILVDLWVIARRYVNQDSFVSERTAKNEFVKSPADEVILKDTDSYFRVFNISRDPFKEVHTSYFHKSIGGYHGAKLQRYQDLIEYYLTPSMDIIRKTLQDSVKTQSIHTVLQQQQVLNMLNARYIIVNPQGMPLINTSAFGNAWTVENIEMVPNADEEINALSEFNLQNTAVIEDEFADYIADFKPQPKDSGNISLIKLTTYEPNFLQYQANMKKDELVVFSEVYYPKGWNAYIDGKKKEHIRANYILRAMIVPEGNHLIEFRFEPQSLATGRTLASVSSIVVILIILVYLGSLIYQWSKQKPEPVVDTGKNEDITPKAPVNKQKKQSKKRKKK